MSAQRNPNQTPEYRYDYVKNPPDIKQDEGQPPRAQLLLVKGNRHEYVPCTVAILRRCKKEKWDYKFDHFFDVFKNPDTGIVTEVKVVPRPSAFGSDEADEEDLQDHDLVVTQYADGSFEYTKLTDIDLIEPEPVMAWFKENSDKRIRSGTVIEKLTVDRVDDSGGVAQYYMSLQ